MSKYPITVVYDFKSRFLVVFSSNYRHHLVWKIPFPDHFFPKISKYRTEIFIFCPLANTTRPSLKRIRQKYRNAGFPLRFINEKICNSESGKEEIIITEWLFDERKTFPVRFPYPPVNEKFSKSRKFH